MLLVAFQACQTQEDAVGLSISSSEFTMAAEGGEEQLQIQVDGRWTASTTAPWLSLSPANGEGSAQLKLHVDSTLLHEKREAEVRFTSSTGTPIYLHVNQMGYGKSIVLNQDSIQLPYSEPASKRHFDLKVSTNVPFQVLIDYETSGETWLEAKDYEVTLDRGARPRTTTLQFEWKLNANDVARKATIHLLPKNTEDVLDFPANVTVFQATAPKITDDRQGDSLAVILALARTNCMTEVDPSENMMYWDNVTLWEAQDKDLPGPEAVGRIRYVGFTLVNTEESLPPEISHLRYVERLSFYGNYNTMLKSIALGNEVCNLKYLKHLQVAAYGLVSLPDDLVKLGGTLETLDLNSNNFTDIPSILTKENFPKLKSLNLSTNRRRTCEDLRNRGTYEGGIGLHINFNTKPKNAIRNLFLWDNLEKLALSYNYLEGELPDFHVGEEGVTAWTLADVTAWGGDTLKNMVGRPKILPRMKDLRLNLNFLSGPLPQWILYHPHLLDWNPESFIFTTQDKGITSSGTFCGFTNVPTDFEYYYSFFPGYREKYYIEAE